MQRKFITNLILLLSLNLLIKPFWVLGVDRHIQNIVGNMDYGFYSSLLNFTFLFNILLDFGITNFNNKTISQNRQLLNKYFSGLIIIRLLAAVLYSAVIFLIGKLIGYTDRQFYFLAFLCLNQFLLASVLYFRSNIAALHFFRIDSLISVLDRSLMIIFAIILLKGWFVETKFQIEWLVYIQTLAYLITAMTAASIVFAKSNFRRLYWNPLFFLAILKQSYPFAILTLLMAFYNRFDQVLIERIIPGDEGDMQVGIYAAAFRILDAFNMIAYLFSVLLLPIFSRMIKQKEDITKLLRLAFTLLFVISITISSISYFYSDDLIGLLYVNNVEESSRVFGVLMSGFVAISTTYVFGTLLTANGSLRYLNFVALSGMVISIGLNLLLIPSMKAMGSAVASVSAQFFTAILQIVLAFYIFNFKRDNVYLIRLFLFFLIIILSGFISREMETYYIGIVIMLITAGTSVFLFKLVKLKNVIALIKNVER